MTLSSSLPPYINTISRLLDAEPNSGEFQDREYRQNLIKETAYSSVVFNQKEERYRKSVALCEKVSSKLSGRILDIAFLVGGIFVGAFAIPHANSSNGFAAHLVKWILIIEAFSVIAKFALSLVEYSWSLLSVPTANLYYKYGSDESPDELFKKDLLISLLRDVDLNPICPLTSKAIRIPAIPGLGKIESQLFELEPLVKYVREKGTHPVSKEPMGEDQILSCFSAYRLVEKRLELLLQDKGHITDVDEKSWQKLEIVQKEIKNFFELAFKKEAERLKKLKEQASIHNGVIRRVTGNVASLHKLQALLKRDASYAQISQKIDLQGEKDYHGWFRKRKFLLKIDHGSKGEPTITFQKAFREIRNNQDVRLNRFLMALLFQMSDSGAKLRPIENLENLYFLELLHFIMDHHELAHLILDAAQKSSFEGNFQDRADRLEDRIYSNRNIDDKTRKEICSFLSKRRLRDEIEIILSFADA